MIYRLRIFLPVSLLLCLLLASCSSAGITANPTGTTGGHTPVQTEPDSPTSTLTPTGMPAATVTPVATTATKAIDLDKLRDMLMESDFSDPSTVEGAVRRYYLANRVSETSVKIPAWFEFQRITEDGSVTIYGSMDIYYIERDSPERGYAGFSCVPVKMELQWNPSDQNWTVTMLEEDNYESDDESAQKEMIKFYDSEELAQEFSTLHEKQYKKTLRNAQEDMSKAIISGQLRLQQSYSPYEVVRKGVALMLDDALAGSGLYPSTLFADNCAAADFVKWCDEQEGEFDQVDISGIDLPDDQLIISATVSVMDTSEDIQVTLVYEDEMFKISKIFMG